MLQALPCLQLNQLTSCGLRQEFSCVEPCGDHCAGAPSNRQLTLPLLAAMLALSQPTPVIVHKQLASLIAVHRCWLNVGLGSRLMQGRVYMCAWSVPAQCRVAAALLIREAGAYGRPAMMLALQFHWQAIPYLP